MHNKNEEPNSQQLNGFMKQAPDLRWLIVRPSGPHARPSMSLGGNEQLSVEEIKQALSSTAADGPVRIVEDESDGTVALRERRRSSIDGRGIAASHWLAERFGRLHVS
jgi:hypothetical protein